VPADKTEPDIETGLIGRQLAASRIPVVDLAPLLSGSDPQSVADDILRACQDLGFFYISNHGIAEKLRTAYFDAAKQFFNLPLSEKQSIDVRGSNAHRGYFPMYAENNDPDASLDLKEGFDAMADQPADHQGVLQGLPFHGVNQWPAALPGFEDVVMRYYGAMTGLAVSLMRAVALALDLRSDYFDGKLDGPLAMLRMLHYPPQSGHVTKREIGTGAHTDYGLLTILAQDHHGGLQVRTPEGDWISAPPLPGTFVVNIGDELQQWSNDKLHSNYHRVVNLSGADRYSSPFFFHAGYDTIIDCLASCGDGGADGKYEPITAGDYMWQRFAATFMHHQNG
jgi:isopenicillin N synthase-like dioxygenase